MGFRQASQDPIYAFPISGEYLFKHYFDDKELFFSIEEYYNETEYRFEIPEEEFGEAEELLSNNGFSLIAVEDLQQFTVAKRKFTDHPDSLFQNSVIQRSQGDYNLFLMKDKPSVNQAIRNGAIPLTDIDVTFPD